MLTDRMPFEYRYLSERLLSQLDRHESSRRSRWDMSFDLNLHVLGLHLKRDRPDTSNLHLLANHTLDLVSDHTGPIDNPGPYVHDELDLRAGVFEPHMGWGDGRVACYSGETTGPGGELLMVALFGSARNIVGYRALGETGEGFYPSDVAGLYTILDAAREPGDTEIDLDYRWDDHAMADSVRAETTVRFARRGATGRSERLEFVARVFGEYEDVDIDNGESGRLILGSPLWIATPKPVAR